MAEMLEVYDLEGNLLGTQNRNEFYKEIKEEYKRTGKVTRKVKTIRLLLLNSKGRIYIQKRSDEKQENPGLYDKTIGGHVKNGQSYTLALVQECHEELGFPAVLLTDEEFQQALTTTDLSIVGIFRKVEHISNLISLRKHPDGDFETPYMCNFYIGYYDGSIRFKDGESSGIEVMTAEQLEKR